MIIPSGSINVSVYYYIVQDDSGTSPGEPATGLLFSNIETGGSASYARQGAARTDLTLITLTSASASHADGGFILVDDTNMPGVYRCDYPDAAFASGVNQVILSIVVASANNAIASPILVDIDASIAQTADHTAGIADIPTVSEFNARTLVAASYFDPAADTVATVTTLTGHTAQTGDSFARLATYRLGELMSAALASQPFAASLLGDLTQDDPDNAGTQQFTTDALDRAWDVILTGATHNINNSSGKRVRQVAFTIFSEGTAQSGGNNSIQLASGAVTNDGDFVRAKIVITEGLGVNQEAIITGSTASNDTLTISPIWPINPNGTSKYQVMPAQVHATVRNGGYDGGYVYIDITNGSAGVIPGVNGITTNQSSLIADARTIADNENIRKFKVEGGGVFTLDQSYINWIFEVVSSSNLDLGNQNISGSVFMRTGVTGLSTSTTRGVFELCGMATVSVGVCNFLQCGFTGTTTLVSEDRYLAWNCFENDVNIPIIDIAGDGVTATTLELVEYNGRIEIQNMTSVDLIIVTGQVHLTLNANCSGGDAIVAGDVKIIDNSGNVTITEANIADILIDSAEIGLAGAGLTNINLPNQTMDITGNLSGSVGSVTAAVTVGTLNANVITATSIAASALNGKGDWNIGKTSYSLTQSFPTNFSSMVISGAGAVDAMTQGYLNTLLTESTAGRIAGNFDIFFENSDATTTKTVDDVGVAGSGLTQQNVADAMKLTPTSGAPSAGSVNSALDNIEGDTNELQSDWVDGGRLDLILDARMAEASINTTGGAVDNVTLTATTTTNADMRGTELAALASVATEARLSELDSGTSGKMANQVDIIQTDTTTDIPSSISALNDVAATDIVSAGAITTLSGSVVNVDLVDVTTTNTDMRGTDSANTVVPDAAGTAPTAVEIRQEIDSNSTQLNTTLPALIDDLAIKKNTAFPNFPFLMVLTSDGRTPAIGLTVTGQRSIDGGAYVSVSGSIVEISNGIYNFDALAADTNGDAISWRFSAATADDTFVPFKTVA